MFWLFNKKKPHSGTVKYLKNDYHALRNKMFHFLTKKKTKRDAI